MWTDRNWRVFPPENSESDDEDTPLTPERRAQSAELLGFDLFEDDEDHEPNIDAIPAPLSVRLGKTLRNPLCLLATL